MGRIPLNNALNMRDLGGNACGDNTTRLGRFFRSDCPLQFDTGDSQKIIDLGIKVAIDLRADHEVEKFPSAYSTFKGMDYHHVPFQLGDMTPDSEADIPELYLALFEDFKTIQQVLEILADMKGSAVYHCAVGKDRTGVITAIILMICGVDKVDILADYQISYTYLNELIDDLRSKNPDWPSWKGLSKMEWMDAALNLIAMKYGDFKNYIESIGVGDHILEGIRNNLCSSNAK